MSNIAICGYGVHAKKVVKESTVDYSEFKLLVGEKIEKDPLDPLATFLPTASWEHFEEMSKKLGISRYLIGTRKYLRQIKERLLSFGIEESAIGMIDDFFSPVAGNSVCEVRPYENYERLLSDCGEIRPENIQDARLIANRDEVLSLLPRGGYVRKSA